MKTKPVRIPVEIYKEVKTLQREHGIRTFAEAFAAYIAEKEAAIKTLEKIVKLQSLKIQYLQLPWWKKLWFRVRGWWKMRRLEE